jgi:hypothetical protein
VQGIALNRAIWSAVGISWARRATVDDVLQLKPTYEREMARFVEERRISGREQRIHNAFQTATELNQEVAALSNRLRIVQG